MERSRRRSLSLLGGGIVIAAGGAGAFIAANQPSSAARFPWRDAGRATDPRRRALSYAILAPNPHNRQPWQVRLDADDQLTVFCDSNRRLPATDPFDRQITIGFGTFLELLGVGASDQGYGSEVTLFPSGASEVPHRLGAQPVASVRLIKGAAQKDPLFDHILTRRTNRNLNEAKDVPADLLARLVAAASVQGVSVGSCGNDATAKFLRDLTWRAHEREMTTPAANQESVDLMRFGPNQVAANPDGIVFEGAVSALGRWAGMLTPTALADRNSSAFKQGLALFQAKAESARAFAWLATASNTRVAQVTAGRAYMRFTLEAARLGLAVHPWSQALQEYAEMAPLYREVHDRLAPGATLQMLVRVGYAAPVEPAPRWPLETHFIA